MMGFNISDNLPKKYQTKLNCTDIETQIAGGKYFLLISCNYNKNSILVMSVELITDNGGFINDFKLATLNPFALNDETGKC